MKLKSNREYWNELNKKFKSVLIQILFNKQMQFTGQEPKLEMFVNLLEKPIKPLSPTSDDQWDSWQKAREKYQQAEDKILFKGFEVTFTQEDLICVSNKSFEVWFSDDGEDTPKNLESFVGCELTKNGQKLVGYE